MYDVAILGAGPAGITASIYSSRYMMKTVLISPDIGGWAGKAHKICNLPSRNEVLGKDLKKLYTEHIEANDIEYIKGIAKSIEKKDDFFRIKTNSDDIEAKHIIFALGTKKRKLGIPGEDEFLGKGVCLCATCDAPFFKDREVVVVGGNDSGATSALLIAQYAKRVTIVEINDKLPAEPVWVDKIIQNEKIEVITGTTAKEIKGDTLVKSLTLDNGNELKADGVFIEIGQIPETDMLPDVEKDKWGHIHVDEAQRTSTKGLYAAGDITDNSNYMRQIVAAQAEGAIAAQDIYKKIRRS